MTLLCTECFDLFLRLPHPLVNRGDLGDFGEGHCCCEFFNGLTGLGPHGLVVEGCICIGSTGFTMSMRSVLGEDCVARRSRRPTVRIPMQTTITKRRYDPKMAPS